MSKYIVSGGTGFVGRALVSHLRSRGDDVEVLSRREGQNHIVWDPMSPGPWQEALDGCDGVVHLAGAPIAGQRWTEGYKRAIEQSRLRSTELLVAGLGVAKKKPGVFVSASAVGFFGANRPGEVLDEKSAPGDDFLARVCRGWENAAAAATPKHGVRSVRVRFGVVLGEGGGALDRMVLPLGVGVGVVGRGDNAFSWVHLDDVVGLLVRALDDPDWQGTYHAIGPEPATQREVAGALAAAMGRPVIPAPTAVVRLGLGDAVEVFTGSIDARPRHTLAAGYAFRFPTLEGAATAVLG
ncbi:MAG: TIGR01777 family oxidoreductase [Myxococcota bacterium]